MLLWPPAEFLNDFRPFAGKIDALARGKVGLSMGTMTIELPSHAEQIEFNLRRWDELIADPEVAKIEGRIETDRHGQIIMSPPPAPGHGHLQGEITYLLRSLLPEGRTLPECPISTADGVKAADVAWASAKSWREVGERTCFVRAPEICVEVISPGNREAEMKEKMSLYFDAGAEEVWICSGAGEMKFYARGSASPIPRSALCPEFPMKIRG